MPGRTPARPSRRSGSGRRSGRDPFWSTASRNSQTTSSSGSQSRSEAGMRYCWPDRPEVVAHLALLTVPRVSGIVAKRSDGREVSATASMADIWRAQGLAWPRLKSRVTSTWSSLVIGCRSSRRQAVSPTSKRPRRSDHRSAHPARGTCASATSAMIAASSRGRDHMGQWLVGRSIQVTLRSSGTPARNDHSGCFLA